MDRYEVLTERFLLCLAENIGSEWILLGTSLGVSQPKMDQLIYDSNFDSLTKIHRSLLKWREINQGATEKELLKNLRKAFIERSRQDLADIIEEKLKGLGDEVLCSRKRKYPFEDKSKEHDVEDDQMKDIDVSIQNNETIDEENLALSDEESDDKDDRKKGLGDEVLCSRKRKYPFEDKSKEHDVEDDQMKDIDVSIQNNETIDEENLALSDEESDDKDDRKKDKKEKRGLEMRKYQLELSSLAVKGQNTIIHAATGTGKTMVAFYIIKRHLEKNPSGKVAVLAEQNFLVEQHFKALKDVLPELEKKSILLSGTKGNSPDLQLMINEKSIFIMTPALIENTIKSLGDPSFICKFTLMFFDECHHTYKQDTYKRLMNEYLLLKEQKKKLPQIVGLTATFGTNRANSLDKAVDHVITIMANLDCAKLSTVKENMEEYNKYRSDTSEIKETLPEPDVNDPFYQCINEGMAKTEQFMQRGLNDLDVSDAREKELKESLQSIPSVRKYEAEYETWISTLSSKATHLLHKRDNVARMVQIGTTYLKIYREILYIYCYSVNKYAISVLERKIEKDRLGQETSDSTELELARIAGDMIKSMKSEEQNTKTRHEGRPIHFLLDHLKKKNAMEGFIIIVKTRDFAGILEDLLIQKGYKCAAVTGSSASAEQGGTSMHDQAKYIDEFKEGKIDGLVGTNLIEEGLNITCCDVVINYDYVGNETSTRQSRGRIRKETGSHSVLVSSKDSRRHCVNIQRGHRMDEAVREVSGMNDETVRQIIEIKQKEICEDERRSKATVPNIPKFESCRYKMTCKLCGKFEVDCDKIRSIEGKHRVLIDKNIWKCMKIIPPSSEKRIDSNIIKQGKIFGNEEKGCTHPLGSVFCYKGVRLPTLSRTSLVVKDTETTEIWELKKWELAPFEVLPIEEDDLNIMR